MPPDRGAPVDLSRQSGSLAEGLRATCNPLRDALEAAATYGLIVLVIWLPDVWVGLGDLSAGERWQRNLFRAAFALPVLVIFALGIRRTWPDPNRLGLGRDGWKKAACLALPVLFLGLGVLFLLWARAGYPWRFENKVRLLVYPVWALLQQVYFLGFLQPRFERLAPGRPAVAATGCLFALIHLPNLPLAGLTLPFGLVYASIFGRTRNLYALAVVHGILGALLDEVIDLNLVVGPNYWRL